MGLTIKCAVGLVALMMFATSSVAEINAKVDACVKADEFRDGKKALALCLEAESEAGLDDQTKAQVLKKQGDSYYWSKRFSEADVLYDRSLQIDPENVDTRLQKGRVLRRMNNLQRACSIFAAVFANDPKNAAAIFNIGLIYDEVGDLGEARSAYQKAIEIDADHVLARKALAKIYLVGDNNAQKAMGEYDFILSKSESELNKVKSIGDPRLGSRDFYLQIALDKIDLLADLNRLDEAGVLLAPLVKKYPGEFVVSISSASLLIKQREFDEAVKLLRPANEYCLAHISNAQCDSGIMYEMEALFGGGKYSESISVSNRLINGPFIPYVKAYALFHRGLSEKQSGNTAEARSDILQAMEMEPKVSRLAINQLKFFGHYKGNGSDPSSDLTRSALEACMLDKACL
jgi:tetratricopeptide (TPR) repeat protein